jgi:hypothetical protein
MDSAVLKLCISGSPGAYRVSAEVNGNQASDDLGAPLRMAPSPIPLDPFVPPVFLCALCLFDPSAAAAYLQKARLLAPVPFDKGRVVLVHHSTTSWETRVSTPA